MRGSPLIRALIAFFAILLLGFPLRELTRTKAKPPAAAVIKPGSGADEVAITPLRLQLTFTELPQNFRILHLGKEIWSTVPKMSEVETEIAIPFPREGVDLQFEIHWPGEEIAAMRAVLTDPEGTDHVKSVWGSGSATEVLTFP